MKKKAQLFVDQNKKLIDIARCIADLPVYFIICLLIFLIMNRLLFIF